jgi:hypothetical protein
MNINKFEGEGKYTFSDGSFYIGEFDQGNFHGEGILYFSDGSKIKEKWNKGKLIEKLFIFRDEMTDDFL